jgi:TolB-like protein
MTVDDQVRAQLDRMLAHSLFSGADRRTRLLRFLIEQTLSGQAEALKESVLAVEVFDRPTAHDPKIDSLVRVEMSRLRSRLIEYYAQAGSSDPVRIEIPKGSYAPVFHLPEPVFPVLEPVLQPPVNAAPSPTSTLAARQPRFHMAVGILAALCAITALVWYGRTPAKPLSVAVLPFLNLTGDPASEYLSDGVTDELTSVLAEAGTLRVVARTSAFQFRGKGQDIREIGRMLNAGALLEGSIARTKDKYRIVAQLIRASDGYHLWAQSFDFLPGELQATEGEVARATVRTLAADQPNFVASSSLMSTKDPEAHELALRARSAFLRGTIESVKLSIQLAQQAIDKDPSYAMAYYLRGTGEQTLGRFGIMPAKESLERCLASFVQAVKLNPSFGDAHAAPAMNSYFYN